MFSKIVIIAALGALILIVVGMMLEDIRSWKYMVYCISVIIVMAVLVFVSQSSPKLDNGVLLVKELPVDDSDVEKKYVAFQQFNKDASVIIEQLKTGTEPDYNTAGILVLANPKNATGVPLNTFQLTPELGTCGGDASIVNDDCSHENAKSAHELLEDPVIMAAIGSMTSEL